MLTCTRQPPETVFYGTVARGAPVPLMIGITEKGQLARVHFLTGQTSAAILKQWCKEWPKTDFVPNQKRMDAWWKKHQKAPPAILLVGTAFQCRVWKALQTIPRGATITYGTLAQRIGKPKAARAVGGALGKNPAPLYLPCHRVVSSTGLGGFMQGFTGGLTLKKRLLRAEGAKVID